MTLRQFRELTKDVPDDFELVNGDNDLMIEDAEVDDDMEQVVFYTEDD